MLKNKKWIAALVIIGFIFLSAEGCDGDAKQPSGQTAENKSRQSNYNKLVTQQPAHAMTYSPTRATKNFWIDTWSQPNKLAYVYLINAGGDTIGYYITKGLPVSYCTSLIPPYQLQQADLGEYNGKVVVPGPSVDGTFSSSSNCNEFYGQDATSNMYIEYSTGQGINALIYDRPVDRFKAAQPLGEATTAEVKK